MATNFFSNEVSNLCLGKPALRSLPISSTVSEALFALKQTEESFLSIWSCDHSSSKTDFEDCNCVGKICMVDIVCFLSNEQNISRPLAALKSPVSALLTEESPGLVCHVDPNSSLSEVMDLILEGAQNLVVPILTNSRKKLQQKSLFGSTMHHGREFCWLNQEDIVRFLLSSIGLFSPFAALSIESLGIISTNFLSISYNDSPSSDTIASALVQQTSIAVTDDEGKLKGEISPSTLTNCDETMAAAITTLSAGDLMVYIDCGTPPPDHVMNVVKSRLHERNLTGMLKFLEESPQNDNNDNNSTSVTRSKYNYRSGSYSSRMMRNAEAIVCCPRSSLVAVMIQAIAYRVNYVWVIEDDYSLAGIVGFVEILKVFREHFQSIRVSCMLGGF